MFGNIRHKTEECLETLFIYLSCLGKMSIPLIPSLHDTNDFHLLVSTLMSDWTENW